MSVQRRLRTSLAVDLRAVTERARLAAELLRTSRPAVQLVDMLQEINDRLADALVDARALAREESVSTHEELARRQVADDPTLTPQEAGLLIEAAIEDDQRGTEV